MQNNIKTTIYATRWFRVVAILITIYIGVFLYLRSNAPAPEISLNFMPEVNLTAEDVIMIVAPHNDDEVLAAGGLIQKAKEAKAKIVVVIVTNGDGHRFTTVEEFKKLYPAPDDYVKSGYMRQDESKAALAILGVQSEDLIFLGYPDRGIKSLYGKNWDNPYESPYTHLNSSEYSNSYQPNVLYTGNNLLNNLEEIMIKYNPTIIISSSRFDRHGDHQAVAEFVSRAKNNSMIRATIFNYLVHFHNYPSDAGFHKNLSILPPLKLTSIPGIWYKINLSNDEIDRKEKAIDQYGSQMKDPFLRRLLESFIRKNELFIKGI